MRYHRQVTKRGFGPTNNGTGIKKMNNIQSYKVDGALFHVMEGEIFGLGGSGDFVKSLYSAVKMLESDAAIVSVELISECVVTRA